MKEGGFIDLHTHGFGRCDTTSARADEIVRMAELQGKAGTTAFLPTIYSGPVDTMRAEMEAVRQAMKAQRLMSGEQITVRSRHNGPSGKAPPLLKISGRSRMSASAVILGVHLEGPFLNPARPGALDKASFMRPSLTSFRELVEGFEELVRVMTVAPEMPGALRLIERCVLAGIKVNMGHSDATYREAAEGKRAGATGVTHLFNAMRPFHHREPGLAGFGLLDKDIFVEVIADGVHLSAETLRIIFHMKSRDRVILVSDSVKGAAKGGRPVYGEEGILSGSGIPLADAAGLLRGRIGISDRAVSAAGRENPRRYLCNQ